jgi:predicted SAM-dependent methyltransferase
MKINLGCGQTPTEGWDNYDNSISLRLAQVALVPRLLRWMGMLNKEQYQFVLYAAKKRLKYGDATKGLPIASGSCAVVYSSHMLEHLDRREADQFLREAYRILDKGGIIRIAVPDLEKKVIKYNKSGDADAFVESMLMCASKPVTMAQKIRSLIAGARHHHWMYDARSLCRLIQKHGFVDPEALPAGQTKIRAPGQLDLYERQSESVYVEAIKP